MHSPPLRPRPGANTGVPSRVAPDAPRRTHAHPQEAMETRAVAIHLKVDFDGDLPTGHAYDDRGRAREFAGWIGLVAAVEHLLAGTQPPEDARPSPAGPAPSRGA